MPAPTILTQTKVEWMEKLAGGGWRIHGKHVHGLGNDANLHAGRRRSHALGGLAEQHGDSAALGDARTQRCRPRWARSSAATAISSAWLTTAISRPTSSATRPAAAGGRRFARARARTSSAWCATPAGLPESAAHRVRRFLFPERLRGRREGASSALLRGQDTRHRQRGRAARPAGSRSDPDGRAPRSRTAR